MKTMLLGLACLALSAAAQAESSHLNWLVEGPWTNPAGVVCVYGEVEVIATGPTIYFCGCDWWPGSPAGGYCGIQEADEGRRLTIFSVWDTTSDLPAKTLESEEHAKASRFGGEGAGEHILIDYAWPLKTTFRYFLYKEPDETGARIITRMYFYDEGHKRWVRQGTIASPSNGNNTIPCFGALNSFLENWGGQSPKTPKLALYRLWMGHSLADMVNLSGVKGDGKWGTLGDDFFLAEGDDDALKTIFEDSGKVVVMGSQAAPFMRVPPRAMPPSVVEELKKLSKS